MLSFLLEIKLYTILSIHRDHFRNSKTNQCVVKWTKPPVNELAVHHYTIVPSRTAQPLSYLYSFAYSFEELTNSIFIEYINLMPHSCTCRLQNFDSNQCMITLFSLKQKILMDKMNFETVASSSLPLSPHANPCTSLFSMHLIYHQANDIH